MTRSARACSARSYRRRPVSGSATSSRCPWPTAASSSGASCRGCRRCRASTARSPTTSCSCRCCVLRREQPEQLGLDHVVVLARPAEMLHAETTGDGKRWFVRVGDDGEDLVEPEHLEP